MDKSKAVLKVSMKVVEFLQTELQAAGLTVIEAKDVAECVLAATNISRQSLISELKKPA
ncbi:hypothetical protein [Atlantibacter sp.]|uniref:hypothetical protein n=1 Tax=Atlantibacter sp. TaxID=1903473 RepID=UPI0028AE8D65|nr:hypothetical protein [Atlantibacter sp.]